MLETQNVAIVGAGLAGSEAAWQLAERGHAVQLFEMRPVRMTAAHKTGDCAELVCSNSFKSRAVENAHGLFNAEMALPKSLIFTPFWTRKTSKKQKQRIQRILNL